MDKCLECVWYVRIEHWDYCKVKKEYCPLSYDCGDYMSKDDWEIERLKEFKEWFKDFRTWDEERKEKWIYERWECKG